MPLGDQSAAGVDRHASAKRGRTALQEARRIASVAKSEGLVVEQFGDGERVVHLQQAEILRSDAG